MRNNLRAILKLKTIHISEENNKRISLSLLSEIPEEIRVSSDNEHSMILKLKGGILLNPLIGLLFSTPICCIIYLFIGHDEAKISANENSIIIYLCIITTVISYGQHQLQALVQGYCK